MLFVIHRKDALNGLSPLSLVVRVEAPLRYLRDVVISVGNDEVQFACTNGGVVLASRVGASVMNGGHFAVPYHSLCGWLEEFPDEVLTFDLDEAGSILRLSASGFEVLLPGVGVEDLLPPPVWERFHIVGRFRSADLADSVDEVLPAVSTDEARPILGGVQFRRDCDSFALAAADGFRLSRSICSFAESDSEGDLEFVVPAATLRTLRELISDAFPAVEVGVDSGRVGFHLPGDISLYVFSACLQGTYPRTDALIPVEFGSALEFERDEFAAAVGHCRKLLTEDPRLVRLQAQDGNLRVSASLPGGPSISITLDADTMGGPIRISFHVGYLSDLMEVLSGSGRLRLELTTASAPGVFRAVGDDHFLHVVMPMDAEWT